MSDDSAIFPAKDGTRFEIRQVKMFDPKRCEHVQVELDEMDAELWCKQCDAKVNPIAWIRRLLKEDVQWNYRRDEYEKAKRRYESKKTTRCEHCKKVTRVTEPTVGLHHFDEDDETIKPSERPRLLDEETP